jgi:hypothetical protein
LHLHGLESCALLLLAARLGLWLVADGKIATVDSRVKG